MQTSIIGAVDSDGAVTRQLSSRGGAFALLLAAIGIAAPAAAEPQRVVRVEYVVKDARQSALFYEQALNFRRESETEVSDDASARLMGLEKARTRTIVLRLGEEQIALLEYITPAGGRPWPAGSRGHDRWFQHFAIVVSDIGRADAQLAKFPHETITRGGPQTLPPAIGSVSVVKFRDPDGHPLEILHFPPGVGRDIWNRPEDTRLFRGIDHTTITVSNTERSIAFYRDLLGMKFKGTIKNSGPTQSQMDDVADAAVRITSFRGALAVGPGIEFLEYTNPLDGRNTPQDTRATDIWAARIVIAVTDLDAIEARLKRAGAALVSEGIVMLPGPARERALTVLDPDGHRLTLIEPGA